MEINTFQMRYLAGGARPWVMGLMVQPCPAAHRAVGSFLRLSVPAATLGTAPCPCHGMGSLYVSACPPRSRRLQRPFTALTELMKNSNSAVFLSSSPWKILAAPGHHCPMPGIVGCWQWPWFGHNLTQSLPVCYT